MSAWPQLKTARQLVEGDIVPCPERTLLALAKTHAVGRKMGRAVVFTPDDVETLLRKLPCPSTSPSAATAESPSYEERHGSALRPHLKRRRAPPFPAGPLIAIDVPAYGSRQRVECQVFAAASSAAMAWLYDASSAPLMASIAASSAA